MTKSDSNRSSGSYIASQLPLGSGEGLPISWQLCMLMMHLFLLFNQGLFVLMEYLKDVQEDAELSNTFGTLSVIVGGGVALIWLYVFIRSSVKQSIDWVIVTGAMALGLLGFVQDVEIHATPLISCFLLANLLATIWLGRGLIVLWLAKKG